MTSTRWLDLARKYESDGVSEVAGPESNPLILHWLQVDGGGTSWVKDDATPWCGAFVAGMFVEAGLGSIVVKEPLRARSWLNCGVPIEEPRVGAIVVIERGGDPSTGHVGFVAAFDDGRVYILGGNQRDKVCTLPFKRSSVIGFRWPLKERAPQDMIGESRIATAAQRQKADQVKAGAAAGSSPIPDALPPAPKGLREGVDGALSGLSSVKGLVSEIMDFAGFIGVHWGFVALAIAGFYLARTYWDGHNIQEFRVQDANEGYHQS